MKFRRTSACSQFDSLVGTLLVCLFAGLLLSSCKKSPPRKMLGKWNVNGGQSVVEYRKDGTFATTQNGKSTIGKYRFSDDSHLELELSGGPGTNAFTLRLHCEVAFHGDEADLTANILSKAGTPAVSQVLHYTRVK